MKFIKAFFKYHIFTPLMLTIALLVVAGFIVSDYEILMELLYTLDPKFFLLSITTSLISYFLLSLSFVFVGRAMGIQIPTIRFMKLACTSSVISNIVSVAGVTTYSTKVVFFKKEGIRLSEGLAFSIIQGIVSNAMLIILLPMSLFILFGSSEGPSESVVGPSIFVLAFIFLNIFLVMVLHSKLRQFVFRYMEKVASIFSKKLANKIKDLEHVDNALTNSLDAINENKSKLFYAALISFVDWLFSIATLGLCFLALGEKLPIAVLITGFIIGLFVGVLSFVPGGIGIQEFTMAAVFVLLGTSFQVAFFASILFRVSYYVLPLVVVLIYERVGLKALLSFNSSE